jgi:septum formation topological specificity factor MinE
VVSAPLSVLLLSEDRSAGAFEVLRSLAKELLKQVDEYVHTHRVTFEPLREASALQALHANIWKSTNPRDRAKQVALFRSIATQLLLENGWVLFHFDGDRPWADRESSENVRKFDEFVLKDVRRIIEGKLQEQMAGQPEARRAAAERVQERLRKLKVVVPFYSIEAWLYQNTREALRLCEERHGGRDVERFQQWAADRAALDEVAQPKKQVCLKDLHNRDLASNDFPAHEVRAVGKSFAAVVLALSEDTELCEALRRTYMAPAP